MSDCDCKEDVLCPTARTLHENYRFAKADGKHEKAARIKKIYSEHRAQALGLGFGVERRPRDDVAYEA